MYEQLYTRLLWPVVMLFLEGCGWLAHVALRPLRMNQHLRQATGPNSLFSAFLLLAGLLVMMPAQAQSPGGVGTTNLKVWLKADAGVTGSGGAVSSWANQGTLAAYNLTQATASSRPSNPTSGTQLVNFNPSIYFDGGNFLFNSTSFLTTTSPYTFLFVVQDEAADAGYRTVFSTGDSYDYFEFNKNSSTVGAASNGWNPYGYGGNGGGSGSIGDHGTFGKGTKYSPAGGANGYYNGTNFSSDSRTQHSQSQVVGFSSANSQASFSTSLNTWTDGFKDIPGWSYLNESALQASLVQPHFFKNLSLGGDFGGNVEPWIGKISEVIILDKTVSDLEAQQINTYLAIKYGITLGQGGTNGYVGRNGNNLDYIASNGSTVVWSGATNSNYSYDITGIGRDDNGSLNQKQSKSINASGFVTLGNGTGIAASNAANTNTFSATNSYELVGDNGQPTSYTTTYASAFTAVAPVYSMSRVWKVQETGTVGTVTIRIPGIDNNTYLLVRTANGTFTSSSGTTEILMTPDGNGNLTAQVDLTDGQFFTFAKIMVSPGCVAGGPALWLKGDAGVTLSGSAVTAWTDQGYSGASLIQNTSANQPGYSSSALTNFNPAVTFANTGLNQQWLRWAPTGADKLIDRSNGTLYSMAKLTASSNALLSGWDDDGNDPALGITSLNNAFFYTQNSSINTSPFNITNNAPFFFGTLWQDNLTGNNASNTITPEMRFNGQSAISAAVYNAYVPSLTAGVGGRGTAMEEVFRVGRDTDYGGITGDVLETVVFENPLTAPEKQRLESYFAVKYGLTLPFNYLSGNGTTIYDVSSYSANVTGIGRDDCQALNQKQSKSVNSGAFVTLGNGTGIAATNMANANSFAATNSFDMIGDNGQPTSYSSVYTPSSFTSAAPVYAMSRIWKVQETGTVGPVTVSIPGSATGVYLLVKSSASFASGATEILMTPDGNGNVTAQVDLVDGQFFTFATPLFAPGCVANSLALWTKADVAGAAPGSAASAWPDNSPNGKAVPAIGTMTVAAPDVAHNFHPYFTNFSTTNYFRDANSPISPNTDNGTAAGAYVGTQTQTDLAIFAVVKPSSAGSGRITGIDNELPAENYAAEPGVSLSSGSSYFYKYSGTTFTPTYSVAAPSGQNVVLGWNAANGSATSGINSGVLTMSQNGIDQTFGSAGTFGMNGTRLNIGYGTWVINGAFPGDIQEVIWYRTSLNTTERQKIQSYLALKYGVTLQQNYLSGAGTTIYDVSSFSANVTGVGREDCQQLNQKQSKSGNAGAKLTIGVSNTIAASNAAHADSFTSNAAFIVFGDNGATGSTSIAAGGPCAPPPAATIYSNLAFKVTETGNAPSTRLQFDASGLNFNAAFPAYMQVATDAAFTNIITSVPFSVSSGTATGTYDFPANSTRYIRFAGNNTSLANMCVAPKKQTFHWNTWWYGDKQKTLLPNYIPQSLSATADMTMSVTVTDGSNALLYRPTVDWWPVFDGYGLFIPRNDNTSNQNNLITTRMQFRQGTSTSVVAAQTTDFLIYDVDGYIGGRDIVKVYGKQGGNTITPQLSRYKPLPFDALQLNYLGDPQQAIGSNIPWDLGAWGYVYVTFSDPVEEVFVEYRKLNTYAFNVYNDIRIGPVSVTCKAPTPKEALADNVYIYKEVSPNPVKVGDPATYKFTVQNTNCAAKTINFSDNLPGGLVWKDSSFVTSETITVGSVNAYGNGSTLTSTMTVPAGTSYFYASVSAASAGVLNNQGTYSVVGGTGASYGTDDPTVAGTTAQPTPLTVIANDPKANLTVTKTASVATSPQNGTVTYTFTINNPNGSAVLTTLQDNLPTSATYVGATLTGAGSATVNAYAGQSTLTIRGYSAPPGNSVLTIVANVSSSTVGSVLGNVAQIAPDINSGYQSSQLAKSNTASTTIVAPPTIAITSPVNISASTSPTISGTASPGSSVTVSGASGQLCSTTANASGNWSCSVTVPAGPQTITAVASNAAGSSSPATASFTATIATLPLTASSPPVQTATAGVAKTGNAASELAPQGGTAPYSYSNDTGNASCTAVAGATMLPPANLTVTSGGSYTVLPPSTPGTYYYCIKVCDSGPTPQCITKSYTLTVSPQQGIGTLDCSTAQITGIVAGTPGNGVLKLTIAVSTTGVMPVTVSGSGISASPSPYVINATATGTQTFYVPISYSGAAFGPTTITVGGAGVCSPDLSLVTLKTVSTSVLNLGPACAPATAATLIK